MYSLYIHGQTDRAQILCGTLNDPGEGLYMINILRISLQQNSIFIHEIFFIKSAIFFLITMYTKRKCPQLKKKMAAKRPENQLT